MEIIPDGHRYRAVDSYTAAHSSALTAVFANCPQLRCYRTAAPFYRPNFPPIMRSLRYIQLVGRREFDAFEGLSDTTGYDRRWLSVLLRVQ